MANPTGKTILVSGATGQQGGKVAARLLADGWTVRAMARRRDDPRNRPLREAGAQIVVADMDDPEALKAAMADVYGVFSVQRGVWTKGAEAGYTFEDELRLGCNMIEAATAADVDFFIYSSVIGAGDPCGVRANEIKEEIENTLARSGLEYAIFRPVSYMDNFIAGNGFEGLRWRSPYAADKKVQLIALDDIAEFVAHAFANPAKYQGQALRLAGDEIMPEKACELLAEYTGLAIQFDPMPMDVLRQAEPELAIALDAMNSGCITPAEINDLRKLHPGLLDLRAWLAAGNGSLVREGLSAQLDPAPGE
jgi:uncharacterized protein YbjT (DUF2867 family)